MTTIESYNLSDASRVRGHTRTIPTGRKVAFACVAVVLFFFLLFVAGEFASRAYHGRLLSTDHVLSDWLLHGGNAEYPTQFDSHTGWSLRPIASVVDPRRGCTYTIDDHGFRSNGQAAPLSDSRILAIGDSFTFGCEVNDNDTWPAHLERLAGTPVVNGGVVAFGIDQMILHAERIVPQVKPSMIVLAYIPDDIERCGFSARQGLKPYFDIDRSGLVPRQQPVPNVAVASQIGVVRWALGYSCLLSDIASFRADWFASLYVGEYYKQAHYDGKAVACHLMARLARLSETSPVLVVRIEQEPSTDQPVLSAAQLAGLDTHLVVVGNDSDLYAPGLHLSNKGNAKVARSLAAFVKQEI